MTAIACLRIVVGEELLFADAETMAELVAKVAGAYLETHWRWPRRHGLIAPFAFVLADPGASALDPRELQALAAALHNRLFGVESDGDVSLLSFEGDQSDVMKFAGASRSEMMALLRGEIDGAGGRICKITRHEVTSLAPAGGSVIGEPLLEIPGSETSTPAYRGIYDLYLGSFIGSTPVWLDNDIRDYMPSVSESGGWQDARAIAYAPEILRRMTTGRLFVPISFSNLVKPTKRAALMSDLAALPAASRPRLSAAIYDTPRAPSFQTLQHARTLLAPHFATLSLLVTDPAFQVDSLAVGLVRSVSLLLPQGTERERLAAISRFKTEAPHYSRQKVLQGIIDVRTRRELDACRAAGINFVSGPAITDMLPCPVGEAAWPPHALPRRNTSSEVEPRAA